LFYYFNLERNSWRCTTLREVVGDNNAVSTYEVKELKSKFDQLQGEHHKLIGE